MHTTDRPLEELEFVAFDLETTGFSPCACRIVEVGAVRFRLDGTVLGTFDALVDPCCPIPWQAMRVHRITDHMVRGQPTADEIVPRFAAFLGSAQTVLMAHNATFDLGFLDAALTALAFAPPEHTVVDTLRLARARVNRARSHALESLAIHLHLAPSVDHRALADARLAMNLFRALVAGRPVLATLADLFAQARPLRFAGAAPRPRLRRAAAEPASAPRAAD